MQALQTLAAQAVLGSERQAPALPALPGAVGATLDALAPSQTEPAVHVLRTAGVLAVCGLAGFRPDQSTLPAAEPCPPENLRLCDDTALAMLLERIIEDGPERLQAEALRRLAGACLPYALLPKALTTGSRSRVIRPYLLKVLGQRGFWLARQNPAWSFAAGPAEDNTPETWDTGSLDQRLVYLRQCRATDPARARELLAAALAELGAKERAALLAVLAEGLSTDDEDLLEGLLKDRSKEVRQTAASLLAQLPHSRFVTRMAGRLDACLSQQRKLLRSVLTANPPETFDAEWKGDGIEEAKPQNDPLGARAWWLYQLARSVPLAWWESRTGLTPAELLDWAKKGEWTLALWRAWLEAQTANGDVAWARAFLERLPHKELPADLSKLIQCLPLAEREQHWLDGLKKAKGYNFEIYLGEIFNALPLDSPPFSADFSRQVLERLKTNPHYYYADVWPKFACLIPPALFAEVLQPVADAAADSAGASRFAAIIEQRKTLHSHPFFTLTGEAP